MLQETPVPDRRGYQDTTAKLILSKIHLRVGSSLGAVFIQADDEEDAIWMTVLEARMLIATLKVAIESAKESDT